MEQNNKKGIFSRLWTWFTGLTVVSLLRVIFILLLIILLVSLFPLITKSLSKVTSSLSAAIYSVFIPAEDATIQIDKKIINSGEDFNINFKRGDTDANSLFSVFYECDQNVDLYSIENKGLKKIDCNKPYFLLENPTGIKIRAITSNSDVVRLSITGALENNDTQKTETVGVARLTITNSGASGVTIIATSTAKATTATTTTNNVNNGPSVNLIPPTVKTNTNTNSSTTYLLPSFYGKPDLAVRVLQLGSLNTATNQITSRTSFAYGETVGLRFEVRNDGSDVTGPWNFTALLPSSANPNYISPTQRSLNPGDSIQFTLGFSNTTNQSTGNISINVDMGNIVSESNESNNYTSLAITNYGYNNSNNNNYNNGCYVNGYYSYNCNNNSNNYTYGNLMVICSAGNNFPETDERVRWYANAYGGNGNYTYSWSGTNNLDSTLQNPTKTYSTTGTKYATVTVRDTNGNRTSQTCSVVVDDNNNNWNSNSDVDLEVEIIAVGRMSSSGNFIEDDSINEGDDAAVKFEITNVGDEDSDDYDFEVNLTPSASGDTFTRRNIAGLEAGESKTFIVTFDNVDSNSSSNRFKVEVDPNDDINDDNRDNNDDSMSIDIN